MNSNETKQLKQIKQIKQTGNLLIEACNAHDKIQRNNAALLEAANQFLESIGHVCGIEIQRKAFITAIKAAESDS